MIVRCATSNPGKLREFQLAGEKFGAGQFTVCALEGLKSIPPPEENGATFEENAIEKARYYGAKTRGWLFADDSGLEVRALGGAPGVRSARYAGPEATDASNNELLLEKLRGAVDRSAQFVCVIALVRDGRLERTFRGAVQGRIIEAPRGANGFGYDPLFYYEPFGCTFGEADVAAKMKVSHRANALRQMFEYLTSVVL
ncbi:MAG TPA: RdgB/HAM1 family non-canonical purine NTP pyrophosphatase [Bryobacteraceae bacterium]|nr:RdgB/HAM1 family non-canonical purine NTP pyrophosphatase [Bryobacteraceae bacterium]